jgi:hypothetical protein
MHLQGQSPGIYCMLVILSVYLKFMLRFSDLPEMMEKYKNLGQLGKASCN